MKNTNKAYLITYDIKPNDNYNLLEKELKKYEKWWHYLERTWIIISDETPQEIWSRIENKINKHNNFLIIEVKDNSEGWMERSAWDWIKNNIKKE